jgi:hypothetical protein
MKLQKLKQVFWDAVTVGVIIATPLVVGSAIIAGTAGLGHIMVAGIWGGAVIYGGKQAYNHWIRPKPESELFKKSQEASQSNPQPTPK